MSIGGSMSFRLFILSQIPTVMFVVLLGLPLVADADSLTNQQSLTLIERTANQICAKISTIGSSENTEAKVAISASLNGLATKFVKAGVSGAGSITGEHYQNVLRTDLANVITAHDKCTEHVFDTLAPILLHPYTPQQKENGSPQYPFDSRSQCPPGTVVVEGNSADDNGGPGYDITGQGVCFINNEASGNKGGGVVVHGSPNP